MRTRSWVVTVLAVMVAAAGACSSSSDDASMAESDATTRAGDAPTSEEGDGGSGGGLGLPTGDPIQPGRSIIATAELTVEVEDASAAATTANDVAAATGGFLAQQEALPGEGVVTMTLRVPTEEFQRALGRLGELGEVTAQRIDTQDVTEQVVDLESRIASARVSIERVRELLEGSGDVVQLATVEGELARREADLESLLGQQRVLEDQVDLSTIRLELRQPEAADDDDPLPGFVGGLQRGWDGFLTAASVLVTGLGYALPFLGLALLVGVVWLRLRPRQRPPAPDRD